MATDSFDILAGYDRAEGTDQNIQWFNFFNEIYLNENFDFFRLVSKVIYSHIKALVKNQPTSSLFNSGKAKTLDWDNIELVRNFIGVTPLFAFEEDELLTAHENIQFVRRLFKIYELGEYAQFSKFTENYLYFLIKIKSVPDAFNTTHSRLTATDIFQILEDQSLVNNLFDIPLPSIAHIDQLVSTSNTNGIQKRIFEINSSLMGKKVKFLYYSPPDSRSIATSKKGSDNYKYIEGVVKECKNDRIRIETSEGMAEVIIRANMNWIMFEA